MGSELLALDATALIAALSSKRISSVDLLRAAVARNDQLKGRLNAVVVTDVERAMERARAIDDMRARGDALGPLAGLPMTIKDTLDVEGMPASAGLERFRRRKADDAVVVEHVRRAGAVIWGKTNVPVLAADLQSYNRLYGTTNNPWDLERTPGGSSGGAAAAVATGITPLEIGSDIGGSLRTPASFCGIFSHKPTWGLVSQVGHVPPAPGVPIEADLNVVGPLARSARDLRLLLSVLAPGPITAKAPPAELAGLRVGLWIEDPCFPLDPEVCSVIEAFAGRLSAAGAVVEPVIPVDSTVLFDAYAVLLLGLLGADLPDGRRRAMTAIKPLARLARKMGAGSLSWAAMVAAYTATHREWLQADAVRGHLNLQMKALFERYDVVLAPVNPLPAFPHDHSLFEARKLTLSTGRRIPYTTMLQWISLATALGLPATAVPAGLTTTGLPVGAQIIGPRGGDARTLAVAQAIDENIGGFTPPPPLDL